MRLTDYMSMSGIVGAKTLGDTRIVRCPPEISGSIVAEMEPGERAFVRIFAIRLDGDGFMWVDMDDIAHAESDEDDYIIEICREIDGFKAWVPDHVRYYKNLAFNLPFALPVVALVVVPNEHY